MVTQSKKGSMVLETALVLPLFMFTFLFIFSVIPIFSTRNQMTHALIQTTKSLSMDPYLNEAYKLPSNNNNNFWGGLDDVLSDAYRTLRYGDQYYSNKNNWYVVSNSDDVVRNRFYGYLGGDEDGANAYLKNLRVKDGKDGVSIEYEVVDGHLHVTIHYTIQYLFDFAGLGGIDMTHTAVAKMWGYDDTAETTETTT